MLNKKAGNKLRIIQLCGLVLVLSIATTCLLVRICSGKMALEAGRQNIAVSGLMNNDNSLLVQNVTSKKEDREIGHFLQRYVTPNDDAVMSLADKLTSSMESYELALQWIFVSDQSLVHKADSWLTPHEFLLDSVNYPRNPVPGQIVSDCEEQACTLVSLMRAIGIQPDNVRVAIGEADFGSGSFGHAWVELFDNDVWLVLEPTSGPYWNEAEDRLVSREGVPFNYFEVRPYPMTKVWLYFNDVYYYDFNMKSGNSPVSWSQKNVASYPTP